MNENLQKPELLTPLNNWKSLSDQMGVLDNADAVYFGIRGSFSMRGRAGNFSPAELPKLMDLIHSKGNKGYLATNTIIFNEELVELHQLMALAKDTKVDAVICHDIASVMIAKQVGIPFHISTQANISNKVSASFYESLGAQRLILARELALEEISAIASTVSVPIECFVHGAMCTAISGRCYLSAELMGNDPNFSANRGLCIQPCRRYYRLVGEENEEIEFEPSSGMFFNAKDLCMIEYIPELLHVGIKAFKIEGRMRDPMYIGETTACYREAIDAYFEGTYRAEKIIQWKSRLSTVFNRGFHTGFYFSRPSPNEIEREIRGSAAAWHKKWVGKVKNYYKQANAVEVDLSAGQLQIGHELIFENKSDFYYQQPALSLQINDDPVKITPIASAENHVIVGIKVDQPVPINSDLYIFIKRENIEEIE